MTSDLFRSLDTGCCGYLYQDDILDTFAQNGILDKDDRISSTVKALKSRRRRSRPNTAAAKDTGTIRESDFASIVKGEEKFLKKVLTGQLTVPNWLDFVQDIEDIYDEVKGTDSGDVASYIPQLAKVNPDQFAVSVCTVDGQRVSFGDVQTNFCVQSCAKPVTYAMALEEHGHDKVLQHIGIEPSGEAIGNVMLNDKGLPHNPMINSGGIMASSLIMPDRPIAERFEAIVTMWKNLCGGGSIGFNNPVYLSERDNADRNFCLAYMLMEANAYPAGIDLTECLELYFQTCAMEVNCETLSVLAATFANGGICPITNKRVLQSSTIRDTLSLMYSCGMYDFSGEWAFRIGIPGKTGVSGAMFVVVPGFGGFCVWSPRLDSHGNSYRGVRFFERLVARFNFHHFDRIDGIVNADKALRKKNPQQKKQAAQDREIIRLLYAATTADLNEIRRIEAIGMIDLNAQDYDGRTALHLAAAEGKMNVVHYLISRGAEVSPMDRWGNMPIDDAMNGNHATIVDYLKRHIACAKQDMMHFALDEEEEEE